MIASLAFIVQSARKTIYFWSW